jgi:G3E family GTPase
MHLIVIAGFLGAGKTSVLLQLARPLAAAGRRLAVIENEAGATGIDGRVLAAEGLRVKELYAGCICCSLRTDLVQALLELERTWQPDLVLVEPSGVAGPDQVLDALVGYGGEIDSRRVAVVLDATRAALLQSGTLPLVERGVRVADLLLVNKCDAAAPGAVDSLAAWAGTLRPDVPVLPVSARTGDGMDAVAAHLVASATPVRTPRRATRQVRQKHGHAPAGEQAAAFAWRGRLAWPEPVASSQVQARLARLLQSLAAATAAADGSLAGHIKAIVQVRPAGGYLLLSTTSAQQPPQVRGRLPRLLRSADLTCNAILFGLSRAQLQRRFRQLLREAGLPVAAARARAHAAAHHTHAAPRE